jgi:hypothetical protein
VAIKDGKETEACTEKLTKAMEFISEHGNHPGLYQCAFVPFGRGAAIDQHTFCRFECKMSFFTTRALFSKQNEAQCNDILSDIDDCLCSKFIDANNNISFHEPLRSVFYFHH